MQQLSEFISNHPVLCGAFAVVLVGFIVTELRRMGSKVKWVDNSQAVQLINRQDAVVIDVSAQADFQKGHITDALNILPSEITAENSKLKKIKDRPVLVYCKTGQASFQQASKLNKLGYSPVYVLRGGLLKWLDDNMPVAS